MKRGDVVRVASGKPRPAVIIQDDLFVTPVDVLICPFTSSWIEAPLYRIPVLATEGNGLNINSQLMADKVGPVARSRIDGVIGTLESEHMAKLTEALALLLGVGR